MKTNHLKQIIGFKTSCKKRCHVCNKKLKAHEGRLCSCVHLLCMKHRHKFKHACKEGLLKNNILKVVPKKIDLI